MELDKLSVLRILKEKGITHLFHANTVTTACTYLEQGGLLSRGSVQAKGLKQTSQDSDDVDKKFNVWNDIFLDSVDLHENFGRENHYGPVLFKLNVDMFAYESLPPIWVTNNNPIYWSEDQQHYFRDIEEFDQSYLLGKYREMITLRNAFDVLPFNHHLEEIILDDPKLMITSTRVVFYNEASKALKQSMKTSKFDYRNVTRTVRKCEDSCYCLSNYKNQVGIEELTEKFLIA